MAETDAARGAERGATWRPIRVEIAETTADRLEQLAEEPAVVDVPDRCVHDSVVTEALEYIAVKDAFVGRSPDSKLAAQTVSEVETHGSLPSSDEATRVMTLMVPPGKQQILKAMSKECGRVERPGEARVFSAFFDLGIDALSS